MYLLMPQGTQNYEVHNVLLNLLLETDFCVPENSIFPALQSESGHSITQFRRSITSTRIGQPVPMMDIKVPKNKQISRWVIKKPQLC